MSLTPLNDDEPRPKLKKKIWHKVFKNHICVEGSWLPIKDVQTSELIGLLEELRNKKKLTHKQKRQMNFISWVIDWRNKDHPSLPEVLRYTPSKWELGEVTEYNYPDNIYELGALFKLALFRGSLEQIKILFKIIVKKGYLYRPGRFIDDSWTRDSLEPVFNARFHEDDYKILKRRKLV